MMVASAVSIGLVGCSDGSHSGGAPVQNSSSVSSSPLISHGFKVWVSIVAERDIISGTVVTYSLDSSNHWVASIPETIGFGGWTVNGTVGSPILIEITNACYTDSTFNLSGTERGTGINCMATGERLRTVLTVTGMETSITISPLTELATSLMSYFMATGVSSQDAIQRGNTAIGRWMGFDVVNTDLLRVSSMMSGVSAGERYGSLNLGFATWVKHKALADPSIVYGTYPYSLTAVVSIMSKDLEADGLLDGMMTGNKLALGKWTFDEDMYRHQIAAFTMRVLHWTLDSNLANHQAVRDLFYPYVIAVNDYANDLFNSPTGIALDEGGPVIISDSLVTTTAATGDFYNNFRYMDLIGIPQGGIEISIDDQFYAAPYVPIFSVPGDTTFLINTTIFRNGTHKVAVKLTNILGHSVTDVAAVNFQNDCNLYPRACQ